jgi:hypothetical protein
MKISWLFSFSSAPHFKVKLLILGPKHEAFTSRMFDTKELPETLILFGSLILKHPSTTIIGNVGILSDKLISRLPVIETLPI